MSAPARQWTTQHSAYDTFATGGSYASEEFFPGERIGPPLRTRAWGLLRKFLFLAIASGAGWAAYNNPVAVKAVLSTATSAISAMMERHTPEPTAAAPKPAELQPLASSEIAAAPGEAAAPAVPPETNTAVTSEVAPIEAADEDAAPAASPLPPPKADPADPYQQRAIAVGLHPDLSRVLLTRMTPADYRNAGIAIQTALAETPDNAEYIWPKQRKPELALFQVHFVPGATPDCRRYVVQVTKDGWLTTALPMEKCGVRAGKLKLG